LQSWAYSHHKQEHLFTNYEFWRNWVYIYPFVLKMASKSIACIVLLSLNLLFFTMVSPNTIAPSPAIQPPPPPRECPELGLCLDILGLGQGSPSKDCCPILRGLIEVGAIVCICDKLRSATLGINIDVNLALVLMLKFCGHNETNLICN